MEKYRNYLENKFDGWHVVISVLCALIVFILIIAEMSAPVDSAELEYHYEQLETVKQDVTNIYKLQNADITTSEEGITITLKGKTHNLKAVFDENNNYVNATIVDNRIGSDIILSLFIVIATFGFGYFVSYVVLLALYVPVIVYDIILEFNKRYRSKKTE